MSSTSDIGHSTPSQKSKRSRISRLLRRADSSSSSVGATRSSEVSPERTNTKRSRVGTLFRHPGSSSSSLSVASDAEDDAATKAKRSALRRSLSALSTKARHGASHRSSLDSETLGLDTRAASPPLDASADHKMLSPVVESPIADSPGGPHIFSPMLVVSNPQEHEAPPEAIDILPAPLEPTTDGATQAPSAEVSTTAPAEEPTKSSLPAADEGSGSTVSSEASGPPVAREASTTDESSSVDAPRAPTLSNSSVSSDSDSAAPWEEYESLGWSMFELPGEAVYFAHRAKGIVSDVDLRREGAMREVFEFLAGPHVTPLPGWELWLRDTGNSPSRASDYSFVNHGLRLVSFTPEPAEPTAAGQVLYWMYVEKHPAHCAPVVLSEKTVSEAHNALTWEGRKLLPSGNRIDVPIFTQEERQHFSDSLRSFNGNSTLAEMTSITRDIARILLRMCQWEQDQWHELGGAEQVAAVRESKSAEVTDAPSERAIPVPFSDQYTLGLRDVVMVAVAAGMVVGCAALLGPAAAFVMVLREVRRR